MTKTEAIKRMAYAFQAIPQEWMRIISEGKGDYQLFGKWGVAFILDYFAGEKLIEQSRKLVLDTSELADTLNDMEDEERAKIKKAIDDDDWDVLEEYIDEEMSGERVVLDEDGRTTAMFICEIGDEYVLSIPSEDWDFYDAVWGKLYDILELQWHDEEI